MVVASDNGVPPLSSSAKINIDISDVNDNPPLFSQANYSLIIQVSEGGEKGQCRWLIRSVEDENKVDGTGKGGREMCRLQGLQWTEKERDLQGEIMGDCATRMSRSK